MLEAVKNILKGMTEANFSFLILVVGIAQLIVMIRRKK